MELVVQAPIHADHSVYLEPMSVDVTGQRIDRRRPSRVIVRVRSEMGKISGRIMKVDNKQTNRCGAKEKGCKAAKPHHGQRGTHRFCEKNERQKWQGENH